MPSTQKERHCRICAQQIAPERCKRFPTVITCGGDPCAKAMRSQQNRYVPEYLPPAEGSEESADPNFRSRVRDCGYCGSAFETSAAFRYYCGRCRGASFRLEPNGKDRKVRGRPTDEKIVAAAMEFLNG